MGRVRVALERMLANHDPYPGVVIDRCWNVVLANLAATRLVAPLPSHLTGPPLNVFRASLHPDGLASATINFDQWGAYLLGRLRRLADAAGPDPVVQELVEEVSAYPGVTEMGDWHATAAFTDVPVIVPWEVEIDGVRMSMWTTISTFGTPQDVTLDELAAELFYPNDDATDRALREAAGAEGM
jgi:hypothetical protein